MNASSSYEFTEAQNAIFRGLSVRMRLFGSTVLLIGLLMLIGALLLYRVIDQPWALLAGVALNAVYFLVLGGPTLAVSSHFRGIVETSQRDISHLMDALARLEKVFLINCILVAVLFVLQLFVPAYTPPV
jgi:hypothetical protein